MRQGSILKNVLGLLVLIAGNAAANDDVAAAFKQQSRVKVIVQLQSEKSAAGESAGEGQWLNLQDYIHQAQQKLSQEMGWRNFNDIVRYKHVPAIAKEISEKEYQQLRRSKQVENLVIDYPNTVAPVQTKQGSPAEYYSNENNQAMGEGFAVAIIDGGVDYTHPYFGNRVIGEACFSNAATCPNRRQQMQGMGAAMPCPERSCAHGTHVAGIAAGKSSQFHGIASAANIVAVNVFSSTEGGYTAYDSDIMQGLEWVYENAKEYNIAAVNMSFGHGYAKDLCGSHSYAPYIELLEDVGVVSVKSSGNSGYVDGVSYPGCIPSLLSVGSHDTEREVSPFSNSYTYLSLMAHGGDVYSSIPGGEYATWSGTSMAAPQVAGAATVLKSRFTQATVADIKQALTHGDVLYDSRNGLKTVSLNVEKASRWLSESLAARQREHISRRAAARAPKEPTKPAATPKKTPVNPKASVSKRAAKKGKCTERVDGIAIQRQSDDCEEEMEW